MLYIFTPNKKILFLRMVKSMRFIFLILGLLMVGCTKNEFHLNFELSEDISGNYDVTYYATDANEGGLTVQAVASINGGKCVLQGVTNKPTLVYVYHRLSPYPLVIYAARGNKIEITGDEKDPLAWNVKGETINEELSQWRQQNLKILEKHIPDSVNEALRLYVEQNSSSPTATILMLSYFDRGANENLYNSTMALLKGEARKVEWLRMAARSDQLMAYLSYPARLENLVMRSAQGGSDTLSKNGKNPMLILFWQTGYKEKNAMMDSLKALKKEYPDSIRLIADICLEADSMAWRGSIRKDSADFMKRFWAPASLANPDVMKLKVTGIPYFIVFTPQGIQSYRGSSLADAIKDYRTLMQSANDSLKK